MFRGIWKVACPGLVLLAWLVAGPLTSSASVGGCRTDPTVYLSNGYVVTLWADISTDVSNVTSVNYVLHVPTGVTVTSVAYDANGSLENLQVVADQKGTHFELQTTVMTTISKVQFTSYATRHDSTVASKNGTTPNMVTLNWCT